MEAPPDRGRYRSGFLREANVPTFNINVAPGVNIVINAPHVDMRPQEPSVVANLLGSIKNISSTLIDRMQSIPAALIDGAQNIPRPLIAGAALFAYAACVDTMLAHMEDNADHEQRQYDARAEGMYRGFEQGHAKGYLEGFIDAKQGNEYAGNGIIAYAGDCMRSAASQLCGRLVEHVAPYPRLAGNELDKVS